jgi:two-component system, cell cycle sensor histidine kinase and response regulator CckA
MGVRLRVLLVEDSEDDAVLVMKELRARGYDAEFLRVDNAAAMDAALAQREWDVVIAGYTMPRFGAPAALAAMKAEGIDIPFLIVSGVVDERNAVGAMEAGAHDYITRDNLTRLVPALERELREAQERRELRRSEEALRQSEERFRTVIDASIDAMVALSLDGRITLFNRAAREMFEYSHEEAIGMPFSSLIEEKGREDVSFFIASHVAAAPPRRVIGNILEVAALRKDGRPLPVEMTLSLGRRAGEDFLLAIIRDISERKRSEEILRETEAQLRLSQKMEAIGRLAGGVAHDFNNLLGAIMGYTDVIQHDLKQGDPLLLDIEEISRAAKRAAELTQQLLAFSRRQVMLPKVLNLNDVIRSAEKMLGRLIGEDVDFSVRLDETLGNVKADPGQIEQVIMNLVINARDAMPSGGQLVLETESVSLQAGSEKNGEGAARDWVRISVIDTGCGMNADTLARIFEPFFTTKEKGKGTGLGLSTAYGIVEQSGGTIRVHSAVGNGTTVDVVFPRVEEEVLADPQTRRDGQLCGTETILVVEDEEMLRTLISRMLRLAGYQVLTASHGGEALFLCERYEGRIDLLLTDVVMPHMNGRELAERLAEGYPTMKVLFMSGYTDDTIVRHGMAEWNLDVIQKPFSANTLSAKVRATLDAVGGDIRGAARRNA